MAIKDTFLYSSRWDSVGLDCSFCVHYAGPNEWPDTYRISSCGFHRRSLSIALKDDGYRCWEWFCRDFESNGNANLKAIAHLASIQPLLTPGILYRLYSADGFLIEYEIGDLPSALSV